ncbi:hypothetical protein SBADM41S_05549 [Streptomyces badius]
MSTPPAARAESLAEVARLPGRVEELLAGRVRPGGAGCPARPVRCHPARPAAGVHAGAAARPALAADGSGPPPGGGVPWRRGEAR